MIVSMVKALSLNEIRRRCAQVVVDWRDEPGEERQQAQSFVRDLLGAFGITKTKAALYEYRAMRASTGGLGYIDALLPGLCLIEMKSRGHDLVSAEEQAMDYILSLPDVEQPRWVVTSDFASFRVRDLHQLDVGRAVEAITLEELPSHAEALAFLAGYQTREFGDREQEQASIKAAQLMASLYEGLEGSGYDEHESSVFLVRTLFALYADDAGVWERDLFYEYLETRTDEDGSDLGPKLAMLYQAMNKPIERRQRNADELVLRFPYVNGGIFAEPLSIPSFDSEMRAKLIEACSFNWSAISPAIFGSLFQAVKSPEARRELGEHYTTETNILKTINPLFLDELRAAFALNAHSVPGLKKLRDELGRLRVLDPACGCGNFLVIAYRELRALDLEILLRLQELGDTSELPGLFFTRDNLPVVLDHFAGIEIEEWPARIATTALHLVDHQANQKMELALGSAPDPLPLDKIDTIRVANSLHTEWERIVAPTDDVRIVGNPPFVGMSLMSADQRSDNRLSFGLVDSKGLRTGRLDYVACWYAKAMAYAKHAIGVRVAFVSTNSITQGEQARTMLPLLASSGFSIDFAHQTFRWTSEAPGAAAVHCVIIGFSPTARKGRRPRLFTYETLTSTPIEQPAAHINFYLTDGPDVVPIKLRSPAVPGMPMAHKGSQPTEGGHLLVEEDDYPMVAADPHAAKYLRRFVQGRDMLQGSPIRWCLWLKDADPADIRASRLLSQRLDAVGTLRLESPTASVRAYADRPTVFTQDRQPETSYFALPEVSSETRRWIPGRFYGPETVAGNKLIIFPDAQPWHAALVQSSMFMAWVSTFAGRLESRFSISPALAYFPIPWPTPTAAQVARLTELWVHVERARAAHVQATLADLYDHNAMPSNLLHAHADLDSTVDRLFGGRRFSTNEERLAIILRRYAEHASAGQLELPKKRAHRGQ